MFGKCSPYVRDCRMIKGNTALLESGIYKSYSSCIIYVLSDEISVSVNEKNYRLSYGDILIWRAGMEYSIELINENASYLKVNFDFDNDDIKNGYLLSYEDDLLENFNYSNISDNIEFDDLTEFNFTVYSPKKNILEEVFMALYADFKRKKGYYLHMRLRAHMLLILSEISNKYYINGEKTSDDIIDEILLYISNNCTSSDLSNKKIAKEFGFHQGHIIRMVREKTGYSLHRYVIVKRIHKSIELLSDTNMSISDIATQVGFNSLYHFSKCFKQIMGLSPVSYREYNSLNS